MFEDKCLRCGNKVSSSSNFCSNCGADLSKNYDERDYGMLGKDDHGSLNEFPFGLSSIIGNLTKEMVKQMNHMTKEMQQPQEKIKQTKINNPKTKQSGISINISSSGNGQPRINIQKFGDGAMEEMIEGEEIEEIIPNNEISDEMAKQYSKLPKEEAKSNVRRIADKIVYEIDLPGVKKLDDIIINKLEEGIEIKAFAKEKSYFKNLPVNYPITKYKLMKGGKLLIEMEEVE